MNSETPRRLGRGLEALIGGAARPSAPGQTVRQPDGGPAEVPSRIPIASIRPNPFQPRREFKADELKELEESLRVTGLLQPITVRRARTGVGYELAAGERRLRAATNLGWTEIPVAIRELSDQELLAVALVENLQRSDLNPIEEAQGYSRLLGEFGLTQQAVADRVGKERSTVANMLRLLQLPAPVRLMVQSSELSLGHARALLGLSTEAEIVEMAKDVAAKDLSVREVERRVRVRKPTSKPVSGNRTAAAAPTVPSRVKAVEDQLRKRFQTDVRVALTGADKGTISIAFYSADDLDRVLDLVLGPDRERL